jgi:hypothetical protein
MSRAHPGRDRLSEEVRQTDAIEGQMEALEALVILVERVVEGLVNVEGALGRVADAIKEADQNTRRYGR